MLTAENVRGPARGTPLIAFGLLLALAIFAGAGARDAAAVEMTSLYTVEVPLDPDDPNAQRNAYQQALRQVLVRVTGSNALADSEEMETLFPNAARFVRQYRPGPEGTLVVSLDGPAIERVLRDADATIWGSDRPLTIIWLAVDWGLGDREIVAADDPDRAPGDGRSIDRNRILRERVQAVAERRGLPVVFPLMDVEDLRNIGFIDIWGGFDEPLLEASTRYGAESVLVGRIRPDDLQPPRWTWYFDDQRFGWPGQPEESIEQLADALAARDAISGSQEVETIRVTISGIDSVAGYAEVQRYMQNLRIARRLAVRSVSGDSIIYDVDVQGGMQRLESIMSISNLFEPSDGGFVIDAGRYPPGGESTPQSLRFTFTPPQPPVAESMFEQQPGEITER
jgi:hypothetical protein